MDNTTKPDYQQLFISWSKEFSAQVDRVYSLIGGAHHGELGNHREILFRNFLRKYLPKRWTVSTGFIIGEGGIISKQQDVIIWDAQNYIPFLWEHDFVVVPQQAVLSIIEIKTNLTKKEIENAMFCLHSPMFHNWKFAEKNPWTDRNEDHKDHHVPFRGIFALKKQRSVEGIFDDITKFYHGCYPPKSRKKIIVDHMHGVRYIHLIDAICVLDNLTINQDNLHTYPQGSQPCFKAWEFKNKNQSMALSWFLYYMYQVINDHIISPQSKESLYSSRGERAKPFMCVFDRKLKNTAKIDKGRKYLKSDIHKSKNSLW